MSVALQPTPRKKISLLVVQLGELEEVFRSLMALKAIKHLYPEVSIHFMSRKETSAPLKKIEWLSGIYETPTLRTQSESEISVHNDPLTKVAGWIDQVIHLQYDLLVNWTFSNTYTRMAAIVTSLIPAYIKFGDYVRNDSSLGAYDAWTMYRSAWLKDTIEQDIHQTDIITTQLLTALQIHVGDPDPSVSTTAVSSRYFFKNSTMMIPAEWANRPKHLKWVAIDLDSVEENAIEFAETLLRRHPDQGIVFLGDSAAAMEKGNAIQHERLIPLMNRLDLDQCIHVLSQCQWVMASRSAVVDLASLLNIRVFYVVQGFPIHSFKWIEEGPYGNQHVVIQSESQINAIALYGAWSYFASEWFHKGNLKIEAHFENLEISAELQAVQVYKSRIRAPEEGGGVCYEKIVSTPYCFEAWMVRVRGQMARAWFCGWLPSVESEVAKIQLNPELIKRVRSIQESVAVFIKLSQEGKMISKELRVHAEGIQSTYLMKLEDREIIETHGKKLLEVEALMSRVIQVEPELRAVLKWYQQMMSNLQGDTITAMAIETASIFDLVLEGVELISMYAQKTLSLARPKAVVDQKHLQPINVPEKDR